MNRRTILQGGLAACFGMPVFAGLREERLEEAAQVLTRATAAGQVTAAAMYVRQKGESWSRGFGNIRDENAMFLLGSISKPLAVTALMALYDRGELKLDDPVKKFIPEFTGADREQVSIRHLLTHTSGLPDQLAENDQLRRSHTPLRAFVAAAIRTPLQFAPGSRYQYSSMAILLAAHVAELISGTEIKQLVDSLVFRPLKMTHSAQGLGRFALADMVPCQTEHAAPEAGGGDPTAKDWDWNSAYWRTLGAPWGGAHASAADLGRFLSEFLNPTEVVVKPATAALMTRNQNPAGLTPRGLGFGLGPTGCGPGCAESAFGHTGSTGTVAWADPKTETICVVLTSLPAKAVQPHPRDLASAAVAQAAQ